MAECRLGVTARGSMTKKKMAPADAARMELRENDVHVALDAETPRARILIAAEYVSEILEVLLRNVMVTRESGDRLLDSFSAPLGTLSMRIEAAHAFGLISEDDYFNLGQLNKVRNHCAHHIGEIRVDDPKVLAHFSNLRLGETFLADQRAELGELSHEQNQLVALTCIIVWLQAWAETLEKLLSKRGPRGVRAWFLGEP